MEWRFAIGVLALCSSACASAPALRDAGDGDAGALADASSPGTDARVEDAGVIDAMTPADGGWGPCTFLGVMGTCMDVAECAAPSMPRRGLCPGPAEIQCCLPPGEPGEYRPDEILARLGSCARIGGDYGNDAGDPETIPVCQTESVIWWSADFDIDCDGGRSALCMSDPYYQPETSGVDSMGNPLDASTLPFIVIPLPSARFRYADHEIAIGQVALVLYGDRMTFGIFGDAGPSTSIGEGSFAMAESLGIPSDPRTGGVDSGATYLVFPGVTARVTRNEDHAEAVALGEALLDAFMAP